MIREYNNIKKAWPEEIMWDDKINQIYNALLENNLLTNAGKYAEEYAPYLNPLTYNI